MVQDRFADYEKTAPNQSADNHVSDSAVDSDKLSAINGLKKTVLLFITLVLIVLFKMFVFDSATVIGESMADTFVEDDLLIVQKYGTDEIERYDVVIAKVNNKNVIKRVIGLPGDVVLIEDGRTYINGEAVDKQYDFYTEDAGVAEISYQLGDGEYFIVGDNRQGSVDSRLYGGVTKENIKGIVVYRLLPLDRVGKVENVK